MSGDFFDRLESELAGITRGRTRAENSGSDRLFVLIRRSVAVVLVAAALAASLSSEFPASANGRAAVQTARILSA